jgi:hypothetical protein
MFFNPFSTHIGILWWRILCGAGGFSPGSPFGAALFDAVTPGSGFGGGGAFPCGGLYKWHAL